MRNVARSRRKLPFFQALYPYLGGKRRLCPLIFREIDRLLPRREWRGRTLVDGFLGGGAIALYAKAQGFGRVLGIDIARRSVVVGEALIANSRVKLSQDDVTRVLAPRQGGLGPVERDLVPDAFTQSQARAIDNALALASESEEPSKAALLRLLAIRIALAAHPFSYARRGTIGKMTSGEYESITPSALPQYVRGLRLATFPQLWDLAERINHGVFEGRGEVRQGDTLDLLPGIEADILYADPPYAATRGYEAAYKVLDQILGEETRRTSPFTAQSGARMIDALLDRAKHIPLVVLSFGNETVSLQELEQKFVQHGRATRAMEIPYARLAALSKGEKTVRDRELLVVGWDPESVLLRRIATVGPVDRRPGVVGPIDVNVDLAGTEGAAALTLAGDCFQESHEATSGPVGSEQRRIARPMEASVDVPEPVLGQETLDRDDIGLVDHGSIPGRTESLATRSFSFDRGVKGKVG
jgi:16S rRNA G966 N2-methylase RsmD